MSMAVRLLKWWLGIRLHQMIPTELHACISILPYDIPMRNVYFLATTKTALM